MAKKPKVTVSAEVEAEYPGAQEKAEQILAEMYAEEVVEDTYLDNDELDPFSRDVAIKLGHLMYMVRRGRYSVNQIRKLRAQLEAVNVE